ncbi:MAG: aminotransferase class IV, partial [Cyanophyceae cyanobacterium]
MFGDTITLSINDPGLIRGATLFTTMRVHYSLDHPATQWTAHQNRLRNAVHQLKFTEPNWDHIRAGAEYIQSHYPVVRIVVFPNGTEWITGRSLPPDLARKQAEGITVWVAPPDYQRSLPQYKSSSYLAPWLAARKGRDRHCEETVLTNDDGHWLETATGNLWGYGDGQWWLPPLFDDH